MPILPEHKEILLTQSESKTLPEWMEFFNNQYTKKQIYSFCYHQGKAIKKSSSEEKGKTQSPNSRKWNINQDYFKIWSHNMAYVFGFWCADGCIYGGKIFDITQSKKDKYILKKIAQELEYKGNLIDDVDKQVARINFSCVVIYQDILALGGVEDKSKTLRFPKVPEEYLPDFIRGFFDGNGSICEVQRNRINTTFTSASKDFLFPLWNILKEKAGVEGGSYDKIHYSVRFGLKDSIKIGNYMYKSNPELFLERKRNKFSKHLLVK